MSTYDALSEPDFGIDVAAMEADVKARTAHNRNVLSRLSGYGGMPLMDLLSDTDFGIELVPANGEAEGRRIEGTVVENGVLKVKRDSDGEQSLIGHNILLGSIEASSWEPDRCYFPGIIMLGLPVTYESAENLHEAEPVNLGAPIAEMRIDSVTIANDGTWR